MSIITGILLTSFTACQKNEICNRPLCVETEFHCPYIIPEPAFIKLDSGCIDISKGLNVKVVDTFDEIDSYVTILGDFIEDKGLSLLNDEITFRIVRDNVLKNEAYELSVSKNNFTLSASSETGILNGIQTFCQILLSYKDNKIPFLKINDSPGFFHRAIMLDPARHFIPINEIKKIIKIMSFYKLNHLHLHLMDNEGWCVEMESLPKLSDTGSPNMESPGRSIYSKEELAGLVEYAKSYGIEIIPEIEMPGHSGTLNSRYPEIICGNKKSQICVSNGQSLDIIGKIIHDFSEIFPCSMYHIGGDEFALENIENCTSCKNRLEQLNSKDVRDLIPLFFEEVNNILKQYEKQPMLWFESDVPYYPDNATVYLWRENSFQESYATAKEHGYKIVSSADKYTYFDYPQAWQGEETFNNWMPAVSLRKVYSFDPYLGNDPSSDNIIGVEAMLWAENMYSIDRLQYMIFPRALALSEVGWAQEECKNFDAFYKKVEYHLPYLSEQGINYREPD